MSNENAVLDKSEVAPQRSNSFVQHERRPTGFVMEDASSRKLLQQAEIVAGHLRFATIEGESGVGKETLARHLYIRAAAANPQLQRAGFSRSDAREWLLSETDAQTMAGFSYLDRVDLLAGPGQALLLRSLKKLDAWPLSNLALVASSEVSLRDLAVKGQFLPELAFRLTAIRFVVPPLRERKNDILPIAKVLLEQISRRYRLPQFRFSSEAIGQMLKYSWPGNVRELASVLESALIGCTGSVIGSEDLALRIAPAAMEKAAQTKVLSLDAAIQSHVRYVLELNRGNKLRAARQLGISRSTLYRMLDGAHSVTR